jgi:hypothetical protein
MFDWCPQCEFFKECYDEQGNGPYFLTPECADNVEGDTGNNGN